MAPVSASYGSALSNTVGNTSDSIKTISSANSVVIERLGDIIYHHPAPSIVVASTLFVGLPLMLWYKRRRQKNKEIAQTI